MDDAVTDFAASPLKLLLVDDDAADRLAVRRALGAADIEAEIEEVASAPAAIARLLVGGFDCALLDDNLPGGDGLQVLRQVREAEVRTPIIVLTGHGDEQIAVELMKAGAADYLPKSSLSAEKLNQSLSTAVRVHRAERRAAAASEALGGYLEQMRRLADAAIAINSASSLSEMLSTVTEQARIIVGAHQALTTLVLDDSPSGTSTCLSLSSKYAEYRSLITTPDRFGIGRTVCESNRPVRLTQEELEKHPNWNPAAQEEGDLPHRGWLAAPLVSRAGQNIGVIHLSDRHKDNFTPEDEAVLVQLAQLASVAIENLRLYETAHQAARARERVLAMVSHDLRNPLNAIMMGGTLLMETPLSKEQMAKQLIAIRRSAEAMNRMIQDLLDVTRMEAGHLTIAPAPLDVHEVAKSACEMLEPLAMERQLELLCRVPEHLPQVQGDRDRFMQVFSNLIGNAIKFTAAGGRVTVDAQAARDAVLFSVSDTGPGIQPENVPRVFEPFWQIEHGSRHGAGLGLPIAKGIIEAHGGRITAESTLGVGTTFHFSVPLAGAETSEVASPLEGSG